MNKYFFSCLTAVFALSCVASAQDLLRYNYKKNGYVYTGTDRIRVTNGSSSSTPLEVKLGRILFPDGEVLYKLRVDYEEDSAWKMPKNAPLTIVTGNGKTVILKNAADSPNLVAPSGIKTASGTVFWNYGEYYIEEADMTKILSGVTSIDATKRWSSDGYIRVSYKNNEFGAALTRQYDAIRNAPKPSATVGSKLKSLQDQHGSRLAETVVMPVDGSLSISLVYLYYAVSNTESYDLNLYIPGKTIPLGAVIEVVTKSGEVLNLRQEKELAAGRAICYPTNEQVRKMVGGVSRISVQTTDENVNLIFSDGVFGRVMNLLYNSLQTVSIL